MRLRVALVLAAALATAPLAPAFAAGAQPVLIVVADESGHAVSGADVIECVGTTETVIGRSGEDGTLTVTRHESAELFARLGPRVSPRVFSHDGTVRLVMPLALIGAIAARRADGSTPLVTESSATALVAGDVASALGLVPNYRSQREGGSGRQMLNGVPLELPTAPRNGGSGDEPGIPSDLVESFSAAQADDGSISPNYHILAPTAATKLRFALGATQWDGGLWKLSLSGTSHKFGYAFVAAGGGDGGVLAHDVFSDASGMTYDHSTRAHHLDGSLSLAYAIGATQISVVAIGSHKRSSDILTAMPSEIATGEGPGNDTTTSSTFGYVLASQAHGRDSYHLLHAIFAGGLSDDANAASFAGTPAGSLGGYRYSGTYDEAAITRNFNAASLTAKVAATHVRTAAFAEYLGTSYGTSSSAGYQSFSLAYESSSAPDGYGASLSTFRRSGIFPGGGIEANLHVRRMIGGTQFRLTATHTQAQTQQAYSAGAYQLGSPSSATVTCDPVTATVGAPAQLAGSHPQADTLLGSVERRFANGARFNAGGFVSNGRDMLVPAASSDIALPAGYQSALQRDVSTLCPGAQLPASAIFAQRFVSVPRLNGREWYVAVAVPLGALRADVSYETYSLFAPAIPATLLGGATTLVPGKQIDGVPLHRATFVLSRAKNGTMAALALQYVSDNNAAHLPGHLTASLGVQRTFGRGTLALSVQNALGGYSGTFTSPRYAVPLLTQSGSIPTLATPVRRTWTLRYTLPSSTAR
jgi:hypothetical protein